MPLKRTSHALYDTKYQLVWAPKYRRWIVREDIRRPLEQVFRDIAEDLGFELVKLEVAKDQVHVFLNVPPRCSIAKVVRIFKSISARQVFREYPELKKHLRKHAFWKRGILFGQWAIRSRRMWCNVIFAIIGMKNTRLSN
ncbi:MAG: IS200/IS605 family transposase [Nitrospirales bacterium]|nr:IS200/IS605 family transposase [Nitrospirales bacterium]